MMHSNNFVVAIIHNGKFLKESPGGVVLLPFGSEYQLRLRNKHNRKAVAHIYVDGDNVSKGGLIVAAYSYVDLDCHITTRKRFRFVSAQSEEAIDAGKNNKQDDSNGVIRVDWQLEKEYRNTIPTAIPVPVWPQPILPHKPIWLCQPHPPTYYSYSSYKTFQPVGLTKSLEGCTVEGSDSKQQFYTVHLDVENATTTVMIKLRGYVGTKPSQSYCSNCGKRKTKTAKFCSSCGNKL